MKLFRSPRSYNSQLGAALSLLMIEGDERFALIEAGISQPGEMARLERMISPDVVLFTSLGDAHQEHFASVEEKCAEKLLLALHAPKIIYHSAYEPMASMLREVYAAGHELHDAAAEAGGGLADAASERNSQLVAAFWRVAGEPAPDFGRLQRVAMRLEVKEGINDSLLVDDAYNSDINSLAIALDYLHGVAAGRPTTLILSDILQSGMDDDELYARVAAMVAAAGDSSASARSCRRRRSVSSATRPSMPRPTTICGASTAPTSRDAPCCSKATATAGSRSWNMRSRARATRRCSKSIWMP